MLLLLCINFRSKSQCQKEILAMPAAGKLQAIVLVRACHVSSMRLLEEVMRYRMQPIWSKRRSQANKRIFMLYC